MKTKIPLEQISVASPCTVSWDAMTGDAEARFCGQCSQHVYNLSALTQEEAEALVLAREGRLCVRFFKRADGTMMTKDCPVGWRALKRRLALVGAAAAAVLGAMFGLLAVGALAATREDRGVARVGNPIQRVKDWLFPPPVCVMGEPIPIAPAPGGGAPPAPLPVEQEK
jgi:hypothetical protein